MFEAKKIKQLEDWREQCKSLGIDFLEPTLTVKELSKIWGFSQTTLTSLFKEEPGVLKRGRQNSRRRTKITLKIPISVAERVYRQITK